MTNLQMIRSTNRSALARMDEDSDFRYSFSCPPVFRWIEETEPELFREIRRRVSEGRFCLDEGMWLQPDCFSASGESYVRQCLYGTNYLKKNFGVRSDTAFNADCFGAPGMLPQILVKSGIPYAVFGRPDHADLPLSDPYFAWSSPDGSTVLACRITDAASPWSRDLSAEIDRAACSMSGGMKSPASSFRRGRRFRDSVPGSCSARKSHPSDTGYSGCGDGNPRQNFPAGSKPRNPKSLSPRKTNLSA